MRIGHITSTIVNLYNHKRGRTLFLSGPSGVGKSQSVDAAVEELGIGLYDLRLSTADPTNFGMLMPEDGVLVRQKPDFIQYMEDHPKGGILFLDEITSAPPAVQAPAYQLVLDRCVNGFPMPDTWMVVAAGNRQSDRGVTYTIAAPLLARMTMIEVESSLDDFLVHAAAHGLDPRIMAFLQSRPDYLHRFGKEDYGKPFANQRSWFSVSDTLKMGLSDAHRVELTKGDVGHDAATDFEAYLRVWETMPSLDAIIEDPDSVEVPDQLNVRYCIAMGLAMRLDKKNFTNIDKYLQRMTQEFQVLVVKLGYSRDRGLAQSPAFSGWVKRNQDAWRRAS